MTMLDSFLLRKKLTRLDLIKIDVEHMEFEVLSVAAKTIKKHKPFVWVEILNKESGDDRTTEFLSDLGYSSEQMNRYNFFCCLND